MNRTVIKTILAIVGLILILGAVKGCQIFFAIRNNAFTPPPEAVSSAVVVEQDWQETFDGVGSLIAVRGTTLSAEEAGRVAAIHVDPGTRVEPGASLVELDTALEQANLEGAVAARVRAVNAYERAKSLQEKAAISKDAFDTALAQYQQAQAEVEALQATIRRRKIVAPFAGTVGIRQVNLGEYIGAGTPVVPLFALEELYVDFNVPQSLASRVTPGQRILISLSGNKEQPIEGVVSAVDPNVEEASRTIRVRGVVKNESRTLLPGMFVDVSVHLGKSEKQLTIPVTSIQYAPYGDSVYVIDKAENGALTVRQQFIKLGAKRGDQAAILSGLKAGEEVAASGLFKLRPGAAVSINNTVPPSNNPQPTPEDR